MSLFCSWKDSFDADRVLFTKKLERYALWSGGFAGILIALIGALLTINKPLEQCSTPLFLIAVGFYVVILTTAIWAGRVTRYIINTKDK